MGYTPENNPYIPGDPYSYDLKWIVEQLKKLSQPVITEGSITENELSDELKLKIINQYVIPEMFGAVADANYYSSGVWYKDADLTVLSTDNTLAFQNAIDSGKLVVVPVGSYYLGSPVYMHRDGCTMLGCSPEQNASYLHFHGTNGIVIASGYRWITIKNIGIQNDIYTGAGIEISYQGGDSPGNYVHYLTIESVMLTNFKYGFCIGGYSATDAQDSQTALWNCTFRDIKVNTFDTGTSNIGMRIFYNSVTTLGS